MSLLTNLISYWKLDEASGNALDAHGSNTLTETSGTIASATGKINGGRDFEAGDTEYFTLADNSDLSTGDIDFTLSGWVNLESTGITATLVSKYNIIGEREYRVFLGSDNLAKFEVSSDGTSGTLVSVSASTFGSLSTGTWYFVVAWHDSANNQLGISVNGTVNTASHSAGVFDGSAAFAVGALAGLPTNYFDGVLDEVAFWKRVLTSDERTSLYNSGNGLAYPFATGNRRRRALITGAA